MSVFRINKSPGEEQSDKGLRDKLNNHSVTPPSYIWDNVEENLPQKDKRRPFIFWLMPLAACIAGLAGLLYILLPQNTSTVAVKQTENISNTEQTDKSVNNEFARNNGSIDNQQINNQDKTIAQNNYSINSSASNNNKATNPAKNLTYGNDTYKQNKSSQQIKSTDNNYTVNSGTTGKNENYSNQENIKAADKEFEQKENVNNPNLQIAAIDSAAGKGDSLLAENKLLAEEKSPENKPEFKKSTKAKTNATKWALGTDVGLGTSYRFLSPVKEFQEDMATTSGGPELLSANSTDYNKVESAGFSWSAGLNAKYNFNDNWSLISGLNYTKTNIRSKINTMSYVTFDSPYEPRDTTYIQKNSTGEFNYIELDALVMEPGNPTNLGNNQKPQPVFREANIRYAFSYLDIPLHLQYRTSAKKVAWFVQGGPSLKFLTGKKAIYAAGRNHAVVKLTDAYNKIALSGHISSGISVPFRKFDFQVGPSFNVWLKPLMKSGPNTYLYTTHLKGSIYYNL